MLSLPDDDGNNIELTHAEKRLLKCFVGSLRAWETLARRVGNVAVWGLPFVVFGYYAVQLWEWVHGRSQHLP